MGKYICSDPDCSQYYRKVNDFVYAFIEIRELPLNGYAVCHSVVDIRDYSLDEMWDYCSGYYTSYEWMVAAYGLRESLHIMAECVFEQLNFDEMEFNAVQNSIEEADAFVRSWIEKHNNDDCR